MARGRSESARTSAGRRPTRIGRSTRWRRSRPACASCCPMNASTCSRTRASIRARRRTTSRSRASSPTAAISTSTTPSARRIARTLRPRPSLICFRRTPVCCSRRSCSTSAACSATSRGRSSSFRAARRWTTSSACSSISAAAPTSCSSAARWRSRSARKTRSAFPSSCRSTLLPPPRSRRTRKPA